MIFGYFGLAALFYFIYGVKNSVGNTSGWAALLGETHVTDAADFDYTGDTVALIDGQMSGGEVGIMNYVNALLVLEDFTFTFVGG